LTMGKSPGKCQPVSERFHRAATALRIPEEIRGRALNREARRGESIALLYLLPCGEGSIMNPVRMRLGKYADSAMMGDWDSTEVRTEVGVSVPRVRTESVCLPMVKERRRPPSIPHVRTPNRMRIHKAGIAAMAHFTMKMTIEKNGIRMSVTTTACLFVSSAIIAPPLCRQARPTVGRCRGIESSAG